MFRILFWNLLLFAVPFVAMALWVAWVERRHPADAERRYWARAALLGALLVLVSLGVWRFTSGAGVEGEYNPPQVRDGEVIRGYFD